MSQPYHNTRNLEQMKLYLCSWIIHSQERRSMLLYTTLYQTLASLCRTSPKQIKTFWWMWQKILPPICQNYFSWKTKIFSNIWVSVLCKNLNLVESNISSHSSVLCHFTVSSGIFFDISKVFRPPLIPLCGKIIKR